ncbi:MAG: response regulator transcription factor [[Clostridium] spiroforme]|uniref:Response regulator transcription factor n=1 Tax=Thomasclavelia spiroformis TaxID=29348 RepID=A0A943I2L1_9FIRM|nr:response regulator transcription factor [Thomasclavelia spiroformis]MBS5587603.1 response regulator transcription factor [Thomasclavelia spiroformis]
MEKMKIMVIEDDKMLANEISDFLLKWNFLVYVAKDFKNLLIEFSKIEPQLILLDINLPFYDGFYWCRKIRELSNIPIIYISSRNDDSDKIMGIIQGGDDYLEKPFNLAVLKVKIDAILRRTYEYKRKEKIYLYQNVYFEENSGKLFYENDCLELTKSELKIIQTLINNRSNVVTRNELMDVLWNTDEYISDNSLTVLISRMRSKIKKFCGNEIIQTKKGKGYFVA